jgi:ferredoxin
MCVKKKCVYNIFSENVIHLSAMDEPEYLYTCMSCFRCIQECTKGIFSRTINPDYRSLGDDYWRPEILHRLWYQAHLGKIPVSGAGYRGPFVSVGFDSMWTDMSEIVRPTRDGIHGREYINTCFELNRRVAPLKFNADLTLATRAPSILEVPLPLLFQPPAHLIANDHILLSAAKAAQEAGTLMFVPAENYTQALTPYAPHLIPCLTVDNYKENRSLIAQSRAIELADGPGIDKVIAELRTSQPETVIVVGMPADARAADRAVELARADVDSLHFTADNHGKEIGSDDPRFLKELIREVHLKLVDQSLRQKINLVFAGGIAMAEHMAKAVICGADGVAIDTILLVALECRVCYRCTKGLSCPVTLDEEFDTDWAARRIVNLVGAWHSQLIEVMGAMGIREVRRLRGEVGRSMWFEDLEHEHFGPIFGERKVAGLGVS